MYLGWAPRDPAGLHGIGIAVRITVDPFTSLTSSPSIWWMLGLALTVQTDVMSLSLGGCRIIVTTASARWIT